MKKTTTKNMMIDELRLWPTKIINYQQKKNKVT